MEVKSIYYVIRRDSITLNRTRTTCESKAETTENVQLETLIWPYAAEGEDPHNTSE